MAFRFIHTADIHLDSPLRSLALKNHEAAHLVANATRTAFVRIIDLCLEEQVDALLIAGELYDGDLNSMKTAAFFVTEMERLTSAGVRVFILRGNHDAESRLMKRLSPPAGVHIFSSRAERITLEEHGVVLHGLSYAEPHMPESLLNRYLPPEPGMINIGVLHTSLAGSAQHDSYSPCSVEQLQAQGYTYWALGHVHKREVHGVEPSTIVMPGIPQGRHINEAGPRSVTLVTIDDDQTVSIEERITSCVQFERVSVDVTDCEHWDDLAERLRDAFAGAVDQLQAEHLIARVTLSGTSSLANRLRRDREELAELVDACAGQVGPVLVEATLNEVTPLPVAESAAAELSDPISELGQIVARGLSLDSPIIDDLIELIGHLQGALPVELRDSFGELGEDTRLELQAAAEEGAAEVLARLEGAGGMH